MQVRGNLGGETGMIRRTKRRHARQEIIQRAAQPVDVRADVDGDLAAGLLRGHIIGRADHLTPTRQPPARRQRILEAGQAHVQDLDRAVVRKHHIGGLDVAMHEPLPVRVLQSQGRLPGDLAGIGRRQPSATPNQGRQVPAFHIFHHQEAEAGILPRVGGVDQVGMVQSAQGLDLA